MNHFYFILIFYFKLSYFSRAGAYGTLRRQIRKKEKNMRKKHITFNFVVCKRFVVAGSAIVICDAEPLCGQEDGSS